MVMLEVETTATIVAEIIIAIMIVILVEEGLAEEQ